MYILRFRFQYLSVGCCVTTIVIFCVYIHSALVAEVEELVEFLSPSIQINKVEHVVAVVRVAALTTDRRALVLVRTTLVVVGIVK